jgi:large subunit ribosomal protein L9
MKCSIVWSYMKVILIKDVKGIGRAHEAVEAKDGHALNYLIPKKLAIPATPTAIREAELRRKQEMERVAVDVALLTQNISALAGMSIVIKSKANEKNHLYDAVGESDISKAVKEQAHIDLPKDAIKLEKPIKELGAFDIPVATADTFGKFSVTIEAE